MASFTVHPSFIVVTLNDRDYTKPLRHHLHEARLSCSVGSCTTLYVYHKDLILLRRLVHDVLCEDVVPAPFEWPAEEPSSWITYLTPVDEAWSLRYHNGIFEKWTGRKWVRYNLAREAREQGYELDLSQLALALSGEEYPPATWWRSCWSCCVGCVKCCCRSGCSN